MTESKINLKSKLELIKDYWSPKVVAELMPDKFIFNFCKLKLIIIKLGNNFWGPIITNGF